MMKVQRKLKILLRMKTKMKYEELSMNYDQLFVMSVVGMVITLIRYISCSQISWKMPWPLT